MKRMEAREMNEAIQLASRIPPAAAGSIEVRPIRPIRALGQNGSHQQQQQQQQQQ